MTFDAHLKLSPGDTHGNSQVAEEELADVRIIEKIYRCAGTGQRVKIYSFSDGPQSQGRVLFRERTRVLSPMTTSTNKILTQQSGYNRSTANSWQTYESHRREIGKLLQPEIGHLGGDLCVLGAGNCNDLDLRTLIEAYSTVHLVDIDGPALTDAVKRQNVDASSKTILHRNVDLTGIASVLGADRKLTDTDITSTIHLAQEFPAPDLGGPFDLVLSPCILSQIVGYAGDTVGKSHPLYRELLIAIRDRHLRLLVELTKPGGTGLLVCDMLSSDSLTDIGVVRQDRLTDLANRIVARGSCFPGIAPNAVFSFLTSDLLISPLIRDVTLVRPWVWQLTPKRTFLVYAIRFRRNRDTVILG